MVTHAHGPKPVAVYSRECGCFKEVLYIIWDFATWKLEQWFNSVIRRCLPYTQRALHVYMYTDLKFAYTISFYINLNSIQVSITCTQGEKQKAQLVSVFGIIFGTLITAAVIAVGALYLVGRIGIHTTMDTQTWQTANCCTSHIIIIIIYCIIAIPFMRTFIVGIKILIAIFAHRRSLLFLMG